MTEDGTVSDMDWGDAVTATHHDVPTDTESDLRRMHKKLGGGGASPIWNSI